MTRRLALAVSALSLLSIAACEGDDQHITGPKGQYDFARYVAMGTSVSQGVQSDGILYSTQSDAWTNQLARSAFQTGFSQPLIQGPGCDAPLVAPLQLGVRLNSSPSQLAVVCAPLFSGITLPTQDVAISGATAKFAVTVDPAIALGNAPGGSCTTPGPGPKIARGGGFLYGRVLKCGQTQLTAMMAQNPTFVSVEFGANEVIGGTVGVLVPNVTFTPIDTFTKYYTQIIDSVKKTGAKAVLVGLGVQVTNFPLIRSGAEIAADSATLKAFGVQVTSDCRTTNAGNYLSLGDLVLPTVAKVSKSGPQTLSCADKPGTLDGISTPADIAAINTLIGQIDAFIKQKATENGYAYFELGALYNTVKTGVPYSTLAALSSTTPYGPLISLDGIHPFKAGHRIIAQAAAAAINATYGFELTP